MWHWAHRQSGVFSQLPEARQDALVTYRCLCLVTEPLFLLWPAERQLLHCTNSKYGWDESWPNGYFQYPETKPASSKWIILFYSWHDSFSHGDPRPFSWHGMHGLWKQAPNFPESHLTWDASLPPFAPPLSIFAIVQAAIFQRPHPSWQHLWPSRKPGKKQEKMRVETQTYSNSLTAANYIAKGPGVC